MLALVFTHTCYWKNCLQCLPQILRCDHEGSWSENDTKNLYPFETVVWTTTVTDGLKCSSAQAKPDAWQLHGWLPLQPPLYWRQLAHTWMLILQCLNLELNATDQVDSKSWSLLDWNMTSTWGFFALLPRLFNIILLVLKLFSQIWRAIRVYFVLRSSVSRSWVWDKEISRGRWVIVSHLYLEYQNVLQMCLLEFVGAKFLCPSWFLCNAKQSVLCLSSVSSCSEYLLSLTWEWDSLISFFLQNFNGRNEKCLYWLIA